MTALCSWGWVDMLTRQEFSLEQICGRLALEEHQTVSYKSIYQHILQINSKVAIPLPIIGVEVGWFVAYGVGPVRGEEGMPGVQCVNIHRERTRS